MNEPPALNPNARRAELHPIVKTIVVTWIISLTGVFMLIHMPQRLIDYAHKHYPALVDLRTAVRTYFYRDYVFSSHK